MRQENLIGTLLIIINNGMKIVGENNSDEQKLLEEKRKKMNELINLNNISIKENITLLINGWCAEHIKQLHKEYPNTEWLAVCKVEPQGKGVFLMTDMVFPGQKGSGGEVDTTKQGMGWLNKELADRGENAKLWNCVLHSHHHMGCFWSTTDDNARLGMNDGRQVEWAVVTAYDKDGTIDYKGCVNFYKPYNIEIDADVRNADEPSIVEKYEDYLTKVAESETAFYEFLTEENKDYIESITETPSYSRLLDYLGIDITEELKENYEKIKDKIGNPELLDYIKELEDLSHNLALQEVNNGGVYSDMLVEYGAFCEWSDNLLTQLEEHRKQETITPTVISSPISKTAYPSNRLFDFDDDENIYTADRYAESYVRYMFRIDQETPMKIGEDGEWLVWDDYIGDYLYVEYWADERYYYE